MRSYQLLSAATLLAAAAASQGAWAQDMSTNTTSPEGDNAPGVALSRAEVAAQTRFYVQSGLDQLKWEANLNENIPSYQQAKQRYEHMVFQYKVDHGEIPAGSTPAP